MRDETRAAVAYLTRDLIFTNDHENGCVRAALRATESRNISQILLLTLQRNDFVIGTNQGKANVIFI